MHACALVCSPRAHVHTCTRLYNATQRNMQATGVGAYLRSKQHRHSQHRHISGQRPRPWTTASRYSPAARDTRFSCCFGTSCTLFRSRLFAVVKSSMLAKNGVFTENVAHVSGCCAAIATTAAANVGALAVLALAPDMLLTTRCCSAPSLTQPTVHVV
jgi:hypothetical protein